MLLDADNSLQLPSDNELVLDAGEGGTLQDADALALLPSWARSGVSVVRSGVVTSARRYWEGVRARLGRVFGALQTPRNATGLRLADHGALRRRPRAPGESEGAYRARLLVRPAKVTPTALRAAVASIATENGLGLADPQPLLFEPATEGWFLQNGDDFFAPWMCFVQPSGGPTLWADMPDNPIPAGAWLMAEATVSKPLFVVLVPGSLVDDAVDGFVLIPEAGADPETLGRFVGEDASYGPLVAWAYIAGDAPPLVEQVLREVESRRGGGVLWWLLVVPNLGDAR